MLNWRRKKFNYYRKEYSNPFFHHRRGGGGSFNDARLSWRGKLILAFSILLVGSGVWFFYFSNFFVIASVKVEGTVRTPSADIENLAQDQIQKRRFIFGSQKNIFLFDKADFLNSINEQYNFQNVSVKRGIPRTLYINIKEKEPKAAWLEDGNYYLIDEGGKVIDTSDQTGAVSDKYPLIENKGNQKITLKIANISKEILNFTSDLFNMMKQYQDFLKIGRFVKDDDVDTIKMQLANGPAVYFNTKADLKKQVDKMVALYKDELKNDFNKKTYLDLRYGDMIYYR